MAKSSRGGRRGGSVGGAAGMGIISNVPINPQALTQQDADQLRQQQDSMYDANTTAAVKQYISDTNFDGQGHSLSQTMNFLMDQGVDLQTASLAQINKQFGLNLGPRELASMQYTDAYMAVAMHSIGKAVSLQRGAHDDLLRDTFGISDYSKMSDKQLQQALVGKTFATTSYMSTSFDVSKNPFLNPNSPVSGGREVVYNIKAGSNTQMLFGAKKQSEVIVNKGTNFRITGVRFTGRTASPRGKSSRPQIEIDIETY